MNYNSTNNEIMFDCWVDLLNGKPSKITESKIAFYIGTYYHSKGDESVYRQNYSFDNWAGIYCWCADFDRPSIKKLPLLGHHSKHPARFAFFLAHKLGIGKSVVALDALISCARRYKTLDNGTKEIRTSGKILNYFKAKSLGMDKTLCLMTKLINTFPGSWGKVFEIYFPKGHRVLNAYWRACGDNG